MSSIALTASAHLVAWGPKNALQAAFLAHMLMCGILLAFGLVCRFKFAYLFGWFFIVGCLVLEHFIARRRSLNWIKCFVLQVKRGCQHRVPPRRPH